MRYEWYADVFWLTCFLTDLIAFLTAAFVDGQRVKPGRGVAAAALSAFMETILFVVMNRYIRYRMAMAFGINPLLILIFMRPKGLKEFFKGYLTVCGVILFIGGVQSFLGETGGGNGHQSFWLILEALVSAGLICFLKLRRGYRQNLCQEELVYKGQHMMLKGFCDTGNMLRDPYTGKPVSIAGEHVIGEKTEEGAGVRYIPYRTLGNEHGLLKVLTVDKMYIYLPGKKLEVMRPVIGLKENGLLEEKSVDLILNGALLTERG